MMANIISEAEKRPKERPLLRNIDLSSVNSSVMVAASMMAEKIGAKRIVSVTESGHSCQKIACFRPHTLVLGVTNNIKAARKLCLYWGVAPYLLLDYNEDNFDFQRDVINKVKKEKFLKKGDKIVITRGDGSFFSKGSSNSVKVEILKDMPSVPGGDEGLESVEFDKGKILLDTNICASCQNCVAICPHEIWKVTNEGNKETHIAKENAPECTFDMECVRTCPTGAIEIISNEG